MEQIEWVPGQVSKGTNIDLPTGAVPIRTVVKAIIFDTSANNMLDKTSDVTVVDKDTIKFTATTLANGDAIILTYLPVGAYGKSEP